MKDATPAELSATSAKRYPPIVWRAIFWAAIAAWFTAIALIALSYFLSLGLGVISLFAGSLEGFKMIAIAESNRTLLFWCPLALLAALYVFRFTFLKQRSPATMGQRLTVALTGAFAGALLTVFASLAVLGR